MKFMHIHFTFHLVIRQIIYGVLLGIVTVGSGCLGYRLGSTLPSDIATISVATFSNKTDEPFLETIVTEAVSSALQRDGTLRVATMQNSDVVLSGTIISLVLTPLRYERDNVRTTREYRLTLNTEIVLARTGTNEKIMRRKVTGETTFEPAGDIASAKRSALPYAARDLARHIVDAVVEYW